MVAVMTDAAPWNRRPRSTTVVAAPITIVVLDSMDATGSSLRPATIVENISVSTFVAWCPFRLSMRWSGGY